MQITAFRVCRKLVVCVVVKTDLFVAWMGKCAVIMTVTRLIMVTGQVL
jgi:hypothetical protein